MSAASIPNPSGHPARFSGDIVQRLREALFDHYPEPERRPFVFDPFAGTGERLAEMTGPDFYAGGVELYSDFIVNSQLVKVGDATDPSVYPDEWFVIVTSPVYPNGMAEAWKVSEADTSTRNTYASNRKQKTKRNDMGVLGYRGTKRGGRSLKRIAYWAIADAAVGAWSSNEHCEAVYLNVSDFKSSGEVEPLVQDWRDLLRAHGWRPVTTYRVVTPRHRGNEHAEERVGFESIIVAVRD